MLVGDVLPGVNEYRVIVRVNGVVRAVESASWDTEMTGDLPDQVIASGGLGGASGTIAWAPQEAVQARPVSPWAKAGGWPPSPGDLVQVQVSDGVTTWTRFTGVIDDTTGDPTAGFQSRVIDFRDRITGTFTHAALLRHMTPFVEDGAYRSVGLNHWFPLTQALRSTGFCNVPPIEAPSAMSATMQGSVWPEAGMVSQSGGVGGEVSPTFYWTDFGYAMGGGNVHYVPRLNESTSTPVQITMVVPPTHAGTASVDVVYTNGVVIRLQSTTSRRMVGHMSTDYGNTWITDVVAQADSGYTIAQLLVKNGVWTLRTNGSSEASTATQALPAGTMSRVQITTRDTSRLAGIQVSHPNSSTREFASLGFSPSMRFQASGLASTMDMMPALRGRSVADLVDEIMSATLTASWWDETGTLILRPSDTLRGTTSSQTLTTLNDITSLAWEDSLQSVRSGVEVSWKNPVISKAKQFRLELWRGATDSLITDSDPVIEFVGPESGMEWFGVDRDLRFLDSSNWGAYNSRRGSFCGFWYSNSDGDPITTGDARVNYDLLYSDSLKVTHRVVSLPSGAEANTETHPEATALKAYLRGQSLPVVRGMGRGEWVDETYRTSAGPATASVLAHDLAYWGHEYFEGGSVAQRIGDYLAQMVTAPQPTITDLGVVYDPRRQVGDVYTIRSEWIGIELRCLVTAISEDHGTGSHQSLTVRVISATSIRPVTYDDLAAAWDSGNYSSLNAAWAALTYNDLAADPLEGAPS